MLKWEIRLRHETKINCGFPPWPWTTLSAYMSQKKNKDLNDYAEIYALKTELIQKHYTVRQIINK